MQRRSIERSIVYAVVAALVALAALAVTRPALSALSVAAPVRIMPLGDSITGGPGCWRALLWDRLQRTGYTNIDFVGTLPGGGCSVAHDGDNEGHGGFQATGIADQNQLPPWLAATNPNVVLMHLGTNDVWNNKPAATILTAFGKLVDQMRANNPSMKILVAQIIPMTPSGCTWCPGLVSQLNSAIPGWAAGKSTAQSPITVVDQFTGFDTAVDTTDGVHPDDSGFQKMSDRWYPVLIPHLGGATPSPTASQTGSPTPSPSSSPSPQPGSCTAAYRVAGQWQGGFQGEVTVRNTGTTVLPNWRVTWTYANGQTIGQIWGATHTQQGAAVTVLNVDYTGNIAPNETKTFGFIASWNNTTNAVPANIACARR